MNVIRAWGQGAKGGGPYNKAWDQGLDKFNSQKSVLLKKQ